MSEQILLKVTDAKGEVIKEVPDFELPTEFEELEILPGKEAALKYVRNQMKIMERARYKTHAGVKKPGAISKEASKEIRDGLKSKTFSEEELIAFIKAKRAAAGKA